MYVLIEVLMLIDTACRARCTEVKLNCVCLLLFLCVGVCVCVCVCVCEYAQCKCVKLVKLVYS